MNVPRRPGGETPWGMPQEVYWDKADGATIRRGQWVINHCPDVPIEEIKHEFVMYPEEVNQLDLSVRQAAAGEAVK